MNRFIQSILKTKTLFIFFSVLIIAFLADFTYLEYINTEEINSAYQHEKQVEQEAVVYNDYEDLMTDDFKDDLAEIDLDEVEDTETGSAYWDDIYFNITYVVVPLTAGCLAFCFLIFIGFRFTDAYSKISFGDLFKSILFAYLIFPLMDLLGSIWFGLIQTDYQIGDLRNVYGSLNPSVQSFIESPKEYQWYNYLLSDMNLQSLIFVLLIPLFLKGITGYKYTTLLKKMWIPFIGYFIIYYILSPYKDYLMLIFD
ncbi:hypothetical protein [Ancylomarina sp. 16SWW S1-10-2]|uniref:hypothetical protein n=1 Tax=Ancylomarina sp. 16SWW S1-10-2 TaxID=2499681 RepID=UPI0012AE5351|nr:hypothetical protein [Ancylomarina sp. 16SWW S1-10-2]MRT92326.1 hypothetical protein [Ancylomarina sp. 16SWW S1-10-2]